MTLNNQPERTVSIPRSRQPLPEGYTYGDYLNWPGGEGWWILRESDDARVVGHARPDVSEMPDASSIDEAMEVQS